MPSTDSEWHADPLPGLPYRLSPAARPRVSWRRAVSEFTVEELPLYPISGEGEHVILEVTRAGHTTAEVEAALGSALGVTRREIGRAGTKDKHATTTQRFSIHAHHADPEALAAQAEEALGYRVRCLGRHGNKLRPGHLAGNRFRVRLTCAGDRSVTQAELERRAVELTAQGLPNYYGPQRFGLRQDNYARAARLLGRGRVSKRGSDRRLVEAWQAHLFNQWLALRLERGLFDQLLAGDLAQRRLGGGLFEVEDAGVEQPRFASQELTHTGPLFGSKMRPAGGDAQVLELEVLARAEPAGYDLKELPLPGSRRLGCLTGPDLSCTPDSEDPQALWLAFELPAGSYATTLLREWVQLDRPLS